MSARLAALALLAATAAAAQPEVAGPPATPVIDAQEAQDIQQTLQGELNRLGGIATITRCGPVLLLQTPQNGGFDRTFGAVCDLQVADHHVAAVMCDDARRARFSLTLATLRDIDAVRGFMIANCLADG